MVKVYINDQLVKPMTFFDLDSQVEEISKSVDHDRPEDETASAE